MSIVDPLELPPDIQLPQSVQDALNIRLLWISKRLGQTAQTAANATGAAATLVGTAADRSILQATSEPAGTIFIESDTGLTYVARGITAGSPANVWWYLSGELRRTQAALPALGKFDEGLRCFVTDFAHLLRWTGAIWERASGDTEHSDSFHMVAALPSEAGWHACDGTAAVSFLKYDGTLGTRDLPNTAGTAGFAKFGAAYNATIAAATVPTLAMASYTPAGTIGAPALTMNSYTPAGTNSAPTFTGTAATITKATTFAATGAATALTAFGGSTTSYTPAGLVSAPVFAGTPATLTGTISTPVFAGTPATLTGTISLPADPVASFALILAYRR